MININFVMLLLLMMMAMIVIVIALMMMGSWMIFLSICRLWLGLEGGLLFPLHLRITFWPLSLLLKPLPDLFKPNQMISIMI